MLIGAVVDLFKPDAEPAACLKEDLRSQNGFVQQILIQED